MSEPEDRGGAPLLAERVLDDGTAVRPYRPELDPRCEGDFVCRFAVGADSVAAVGVDAMQALLLAVQGMAARVGRLRRPATYLDIPNGGLPDVRWPPRSPA